MIFHLFNPAHACLARFNGHELAREVGLPNVSLLKLAERRGILTLFGGRR